MTGLGSDVVFTCGHESAGGPALSTVLPRGRLVPVGRELVAVVAEALRASVGPVVVLPMTLGRDLQLVTDSAQALRWVAGGGAGDDDGCERVVLADPFGTTDHLVGWLRAAANRVCAEGGERRALLITAPAANPFDDADLFRITRLTRQYSSRRWIEVAFDGGDPDIGAGVDRCLRLGADQVTLVPAWFGPSRPRGWVGCPSERVTDGGPLLTSSAVRGIVSARVAEALVRFRLGDNGIESGLDAGHGRGFAHTHGYAEGDSRHQNLHPHTHSHTRH